MNEDLKLLAECLAKLAKSTEGKLTGCESNLLYLLAATVIAGKAPELLVFVQPYIDEQIKRINQT